MIGVFEGFGVFEGVGVFDGAGVLSASGVFEEGSGPSPDPRLSIFTAATEAVRNGTSDAKILCKGDSTTAGRGDSTDGTIPATNAYPRRLQNLLNSIIPSSQGIGNPRRFSGDADDRWTYGTGWSFGGYAWSSAEASTPTLPLEYSPDGGEEFDGFDLIYMSFSGLGTSDLVVTATGGTPVNINAAVGGQAIQKQAIACGAAGTANELSITGTGALYVVGVEPFLSTERHVRVGNVGVPGSTTEQWASTGGFNRMMASATYAGHLVIFSTGINDAINGVSPADLKTRMTTVVVADKAAGYDFVLVTPPPPQNDPVFSIVASYIEIYEQVASENDLVLVDLFNLWGGVYKAEFMADDLHPNDAGYQDWAEAVFDAISPSVAP